MTTITKPVPVRIPAGMLARVDQLHVPVPCEAHPRWLLDRRRRRGKGPGEKGEQR